MRFVLRKDCDRHNDFFSIEISLDKMSTQKTETINDLLHWIWSWKLQYMRFKESNEKEWSLNQDINEIEKLKTFSATSFDEHILIVTTLHVITAIDELNYELESIPELEKSKALKYLRNIYEHWNTARKKQEGGSLKKLQKEFPCAKPFSLTFTNNDCLLAGEVSLKSLVEEIDKLEKLLLIS